MHFDLPTLLGKWKSSNKWKCIMDQQEKIITHQFVESLQPAAIQELRGSAKRTGESPSHSTGSKFQRQDATSTQQDPVDGSVPPPLSSSVSLTSSNKHRHAAASRHHVQQPTTACGRDGNPNQPPQPSSSKCQACGNPDFAVPYCGIIVCTPCVEFMTYMVKRRFDVKCKRDGTCGSDFRPGRKVKCKGCKLQAMLKLNIQHPAWQEHKRSLASRARPADSSSSAALPRLPPPISVNTSQVSGSMPSTQQQSPQARPAASPAMPSAPKKEEKPPQAITTPTSTPAAAAAGEPASHPHVETPRSAHRRSCCMVCGNTQELVMWFGVALCQDCNKFRNDIKSAVLPHCSHKCEVSYSPSKRICGTCRLRVMMKLDLKHPNWIKFRVVAKRRLGDHHPHTHQHQQPQAGHSRASSSSTASKKQHHHRQPDCQACHNKDHLRNSYNLLLCNNCIRIISENGSNPRRFNVRCAHDNRCNTWHRPGRKMCRACRNRRLLNLEIDHPVWARRRQQRLDYFASRDQKRQQLQQRQTQSTAQDATQPQQQQQQPPPTTSAASASEPAPAVMPSEPSTSTLIQPSSARPLQQHQYLQQAAKYHQKLKKHLQQQETKHKHHNKLSVKGRRCAVCRNTGRLTRSLGPILCYNCVAFIQYTAESVSGRVTCRGGDGHCQLVYSSRGGMCRSCRMHRLFKMPIKCHKWSMFRRKYLSEFPMPPPPPRRRVVETPAVDPPRQETNVSATGASDPQPATPAPAPQAASATPTVAPPVVASGRTAEPAVAEIPKQEQQPEAIGEAPNLCVTCGGPRRSATEGEFGLKICSDCSRFIARIGQEKFSHLSPCKHSKKCRTSYRPDRPIRCSACRVRHLIRFKIAHAAWEAYRALHRPRVAQSEGPKTSEPQVSASTGNSTPKKLPSQEILESAPCGICGNPRNVHQRSDEFACCNNCWSFLTSREPHNFGDKCRTGEYNCKLEHASYAELQEDRTKKRMCRGCRIRRAIAIGFQDPKLARSPHKSVQPPGSTAEEVSQQSAATTTTSDGINDETSEAALEICDHCNSLQGTGESPSHDSPRKGSTSSSTGELGPDTRMCQGCRAKRAISLGLRLRAPRATATGDDGGDESLDLEVETGGHQSPVSRDKMSRFRVPGKCAICGNTNYLFRRMWGFTCCQNCKHFLQNAPKRREYPPACVTGQYSCEIRYIPNKLRTPTNQNCAGCRVRKAESLGFTPLPLGEASGQTTDISTTSDECTIDVEYISDQEHHHDSQTRQPHPVQQSKSVQQSTPDASQHRAAAVAVRHQATSSTDESPTPGPRPAPHKTRAKLRKRLFALACAICETTRDLRKHQTQRESPECCHSCWKFLERAARRTAAGLAPFKCDTSRFECDVRLALGTHPGVVVQLCRGCRFTKALKLGFKLPHVTSGDSSDKHRESSDTDNGTQLSAGGSQTVRNEPKFGPPCAVCLVNQWTVPTRHGFRWCSNCRNFLRATRRNGQRVRCTTGRWECHSEMVTPQQLIYGAATCSGCLLQKAMRLGYKADWGLLWREPIESSSDDDRSSSRSVSTTTRDERPPGLVVTAPREPLPAATAIGAAPVEPRVASPAGNLFVEDDDDDEVEEEHADGENNQMGAQGGVKVVRSQSATRRPTTAAGLDDSCSTTSADTEIVEQLGDWLSNESPAQLVARRSPKSPGDEVAPPSMGHNVRVVVYSNDIGCGRRLPLVTQNLNPNDRPPLEELTTPRLRVQPSASLRRSATRTPTTTIHAPQPTDNDRPVTIVTPIGQRLKLTLTLETQRTTIDRRPALKRQRTSAVESYASCNPIEAPRSPPLIGPGEDCDAEEDDDNQEEFDTS